MGLKCKIGLHDWECFEPIYKTPMDMRIGVASIDGYRICRSCGKKEILDVHCLGLNPPTYVESYFATPKVKK